MNRSNAAKKPAAIPFKSMPASLRHSTWSLIFFNLFPLIGVLFFGWDVAGIILLYWSENVIIGFFNVLKLWRAEGPDRSFTRIPSLKTNSKAGKVRDILFFIVHYGMFTFAHGVFVLVLFGSSKAGWKGIALAAIPLFVSHGISYQRNFIRGGEYKTADRSQLFFQPYKRIVVMHLTIILGGGLAAVIGAAPLVLVVMILFKMFIDQRSHRQEHSLFSPAETPKPTRI